MKLTRAFLMVAALIVTAYVAVQCGDDDSTADCDPPCDTATEMCVAGTCVAIGADADADSDGEVVGDIPTETPTETPTDVPTETPVEVADEASPPEDAPIETSPEDGSTDPLNTGDPCETAADCTGPGASCITVIPTPIGDIAFPGGYCSSSCTGGGDECGEGGYCLDASAFGGPTACVKSCAAASECREAEGYTCNNFMIFPETFCAPPVSMGG